MLKFLFITFFVSISLFSFNQISKGKVNYKINATIVDSSLSKMENRMINFGSELDISFDKSHSRVDFRLNDSMSISIIIDNKKNEGLKLLSSQMGKFAVQGKANEMGLEKSTSLDGRIAATNENKKILGYNCVKYIVKGAEGDLEYWCTNELEIDFSGQQLLVENLPGFPLAFTSISNGMRMEFVASNVATSVENSKTVFSTKIPEGYVLAPEE